MKIFINLHKVTRYLLKNSPPLFKDVLFGALVGLVFGAFLCLGKDALFILFCGILGSLVNVLYSGAYSA